VKTSHNINTGENANLHDKLPKVKLGDVDEDWNDENSEANTIEGEATTMEGNKLVNIEDDWTQDFQEAITMEGEATTMEGNKLVNIEDDWTQDFQEAITMEGTEEGLNQLSVGMVDNFEKDWKTEEGLNQLAVGMVDNFEKDWEKIGDPGKELVEKQLDDVQNDFDTINDHLISEQKTEEGLNQLAVGMVVNFNDDWEIERKQQEQEKLVAIEGKQVGLTNEIFGNVDIDWGPWICFYGRITWTGITGYYTYDYGDKTYDALEKSTGKTRFENMKNYDQNDQGITNWVNDATANPWICKIAAANTCTDVIKWWYYTGKRYYWTGKTEPIRSPLNLEKWIPLCLENGKFNYPARKSDIFVKTSLAIKMSDDVQYDWDWL